ncbi:MAG: hypothetical protein GXP08_00300 [Gammaproteobacteria bacterium]|nr:hypothetical protein [Gammaproteobacteria bacterium]
MRTLFIIIALVLVILILKRLIAARLRYKKKPVQTQVVDYTPTVRCKFCDAHVPSGTALNAENAFFCNKKHYLAYKNSEKIRLKPKKSTHSTLNNNKQRNRH